MKDPTVFEEASRYISGELSNEEKKKINERLEYDKGYAKEFSKFIMIKELLRENKKNEFLSKFNDLEEENINVEKDKGFIRLFILAIFILLIASVSYYFGINRNSELNSIPAQKEIASIDIYVDSVKEEYKESLGKEKKRSSSGGEFIRKYEENKFNEALQFTTEELKNPDADNRWKWLERQGFCYWELRELNKADQVFEELASDKNLLPLYNSAKWYQALIALELKNEKKAKTLLQEIMNIKVGETYHKDKNKADELLEKLTTKD